MELDYVVVYFSCLGLKLGQRSIGNFNDVSLAGIASSVLITVGGVFFYFYQV